MLPLNDLDMLDSLFLTRDLTVPADRADFFARARRGEFTALYRGVYVLTVTWSGLGPDAQYAFRVKAAVCASRAPVVLSHESAAVLWRLPILGAWPERVHTVEDRVGHGRSTVMFERHAEGIPDSGEVIHGVRVTTLARTIVDIARRRPFDRAVTMIDAALRRNEHPTVGVPRTSLSRSDLLAELEGFAVRQGTARARRAIEFADGRADRPGESMSRMSMHAARLPKPELQVPLRGQSGARYFGDFWWKDANLVGEFDGAAKYEDPEFLRGRTPHQALLDEKRREDDIRAAGFRLTRWGWEVAISPSRLRAHLVAAGLR